MKQVHSLRSVAKKILLMIVAVVCNLPEFGAARTIQKLVVAPRQIVLRNNNLAKPQESTDENKPGTATLKTDPDLEALLEKARRYLDDGNYSVAAQLWQVILQKSGDTLYSKDGVTYFSMVDQVERILSELPEEALNAYRVNADAEARQILARAQGRFDPKALSDVVRNYFVSSVGDDAAFELAATAMDRFDFLGALRLLEKIRDRHPDPSISSEELLKRIALCNLLLGNSATAEEVMVELRPLVNNDVTTRELETLLQATPQELSSQFALTSLNSFREFGRNSTLPSDFLSNDLYAAWQNWIEPNQASNYVQADGNGFVKVSTAETVDEISKTVGAFELKILKSWADSSWRPTGHLLFYQNRVIIKSIANVSSWSTDLANLPVWRSLWLNKYEADDATTQLEALQGNMQNRGVKSDSATFGLTSAMIPFFGDLIPAKMSLIGDRVYSLEGVHYDEALAGGNERNRGFQWNATFRRSRRNFLTCYEANSGRLQWTLPKNSETGFRSGNNGTPTEVDPAETEKETWLSAGGFMSAPIGFANTLLVPVNIGGAIYIFALDPNDQGRTIWKTYLCDEPETGAASWSPIELTLEGSDLFVATGMGVVFVIDPATGLIRFAQRYERSGTANPMLRQFGWQNNRMEFDGWSEDVIIPYGRQMICFCSDSDRIFAIDRSTGKTIWYVEMAPLGKKLDYLIGIHNDLLFAGGSETIVAFDLLGEGRMAWGGESIFDGGKSFGRAMLCDDALYVPVNDSIWKYELSINGTSPKKAAQVHVDLGMDSPVGNLFSDGTRIWVHSATRVSALEPVLGK